MKREMSASNTNPHSVKMKRVEMKQLNDVIPILKLKLQEQELTSQAIKGLLFNPYKEAMEISISDLKVKFESLGVKAPKSLLITRYLIEPQKGGEVVFSENTVSTQKNIVDQLYDLVGPYKIYSDVQHGVDFTSEQQMQKMAVEKFGRYR